MKQKPPQIETWPVVVAVVVLAFLLIIHGALCEVGVVDWRVVLR